MSIINYSKVVMKITTKVSREIELDDGTTIKVIKRVKKVKTVKTICFPPEIWGLIKDYADFSVKYINVCQHLLMNVGVFKQTFATGFHHFLASNVEKEFQKKLKTISNSDSVEFLVAKLPRKQANVYCFNIKGQQFIFNDDYNAYYQDMLSKMESKMMFQKITFNEFHKKFLTYQEPAYDTSAYLKSSKKVINHTKRVLRWELYSKCEKKDICMNCMKYTGFSSNLQTKYKLDCQGCGHS